MSATPSPTQTARRTLMVGKVWVQAVALVVIFGFFVMGILAYRTYTASMPQPERVVTGSGEVLFTGEDITAGQEIFLARGLMQYGSIVGHGAYLGPDYTADYLRRATDFVETQLRNAGAQNPRQSRARRVTGSANRWPRWSRAVRTRSQGAPAGCTRDRGAERCISAPTRVEYRRGPRARG